LRTLGKVGDPALNALDVSPDGAFLATASDDHNIRVWQIWYGAVLYGTAVQTIDGPLTNTDIAFSPDGKRVAVATADAAVHIWEWQQNHKLAVLRRHADSINSVQFAPYGNNIITASDDSTVAIFPCTTCLPFDKVRSKAEEQDRYRGGPIMGQLPAVMGQLPAGMRRSCSAYTETSASCTLPDGTIVSYQLFDTATEAHEDVANRKEPAPRGTPCPPPSAPPADTSVVCNYAVGAKTGVAEFTQTVNPQRLYEVSWSPDAHPRLSGFMSTEDAPAQDWESLRYNWARLAAMH
jgi:WD40 repeat protein